MPGDLLAGRARVVPGDAAATAANVMAREPLLRLGVAANLFATACYAAVTVVFYALFKVVNRRLALLMMFTSLTALAIWTSGSLSQLAATLVVRGGDTSGPGRSKPSCSSNGTRMPPRSASLFSAYCFLIGYLLIKSTFLPRPVGLLMMSGGVGLLTYLSPALADDLYPYNAVPALVGETSLMLWLLSTGVNAQQREEVASTARLQPR